MASQSTSGISRNSASLIQQQIQAPVRTARSWSTGLEQVVCYVSGILLTGGGWSRMRCSSPWDSSARRDNDIVRNGFNWQGRLFARSSSGIVSRIVETFEGLNFSLVC